MTTTCSYMPIALKITLDLSGVLGDFAAISIPYVNCVYSDKKRRLRGYKKAIKEFAQTIAAYGESL